MRINNNDYNNIFKARFINLSKEKELISNSLLQKYCETSQERELNLISNQLYELYKSEISKMVYSRLKYLKAEIEDFLQKMYCKLFEICSENKSNGLLTTSFLVNSLNSQKIEKDEYLSCASTSLDKNLNEHRNKNSLNLEYLLAGNKELEYLSFKNESEKLAIKVELNDSIEKTTALTQKEKFILEKKSEGLSLSKIAKEYDIGICESSIQRNLLVAKTKIQKAHNVLPEKYHNFGVLLKKRYELEESVSEIEDVLISAAEKMTKTEEELLDSIDRTADLLGLERKEYARLVMNDSKLLGKLPETISQRTKDSAKVFGVTEEEFIQMAKKCTDLLFRSDESFKSNLEGIAEILNIDIVILQKKCKNLPTIACYTPQKILNNIEKLSEVLGVEKEVFMKMGIKQPEILYMSQQNTKDKIKDICSLLNITKQELLSAMEKQPNFFVCKPQTINKKVSDGAKALGISREEFIVLALKHPVLFYQKTETTVKNTENSAKALKIHSKDFIELAKRHPVILSLKPETVSKKVQINKFYKEIRGDKNQAITVITDSDKTLYLNILSYLIKKQDKLSSLRGAKVLDYLKTQKQDKIYKFKIPNHPIAEGFINFTKEFSIKNFNREFFVFETMEL